MPPRKPKDLDEWILRVMGEGIANLFMRPYNSKVSVAVSHLCTLRQMLSSNGTSVWKLSYAHRDHGDIWGVDVWMVPAVLCYHNSGGANVSLHACSGEMVPRLPTAGPNLDPTGR